MGDTFMFATGQSRSHITRIAEAVCYEFKHHGLVINGQAPVIEGGQSDDWLLVDGGSVVVNVMVDSARDMLGLEEHWEQQGAVAIELPPDPNADDRRYDDDAAVASGTAAAASAAAVGAAAPQHWGESADVGGEDLEAVYREDETDEQLWRDAEATADGAAARRAAGEATTDGSTRDGGSAADGSAAGEEEASAELVEADEYYYDEGLGEYYDDGEYYDYDGHSMDGEAYGYDDDDEYLVAYDDERHPSLADDYYEDGYDEAYDQYDDSESGGGGHDRSAPPPPRGSPNNGRRG